MDNGSGFENRMNQAAQNNTNANMQDINKKDHANRESDFYKQNSKLGRDSKRNESSGKNSSKSPKSSGGSSSSGKGGSSGSINPLSSGGSGRSSNSANKGSSLGRKAKNAVGSTALQAVGVPKPLADMAVNNKMTQRLMDISDRRKHWKMRAFNKLVDSVKPKEEENANTPDGNQGDPTEPVNKKSENSVEEISIRVPFKIKVALIISACTLAVCMILLIAIINTDTIQKVIANGFSVNIFKEDDSAADIDDDGNNSGEWETDDNSYIEKSANVYLTENDSDADSVLSKTKYTTYKSSKDVDLSSLKEYYKIDCSGQACEKTNIYKFYRKLYDIYFMYKYKYNVKIDLSLLMSTLNYNAESQDDTFSKNQGEYDIDAVRENGYKNENITILDWENDFKNLSGYTYLNANDFRYDMQILAKNMVKKEIKYKCTKSSDSSDDDSDSDDLKGITDNSKKGNGWNSVTKIKYSNGIERTYRNYKQFNNGNNYWNYPYWGGNIASSGCGPSSVAIVLSGYGYDANPKDVIKKMAKKGLRISSYENLVAALKMYNIKSEVKSWTSNSEKEIKDNFNAGRPVIVNVPHHYVAYLGLNKNGKLIISDPGKNDGNHSYYGSTISEVKSRNSGRQYILIKSNGSSSNSSSVSFVSKERLSYSTPSSSSSGAGKVIKKSNYNAKGGYSGIYESRTTGKKFKEYKQNSSWVISKFPNTQWKSECGKISALTIGSGYSNKATYSNLYNNILGKGSKSATVHGIIDTYTKTSVDFKSMVSIKSLKKYLSKGYVASIHVSRYPNTSTHYLSILDINASKTKIYISDPWGGSSYNGWKDISIVNRLGAHEICLVPSDGKTINHSTSQSSFAENKVFYIGDSWIEALDSFQDAKSPKKYFYYKIGKNADWALSNYSTAQSSAYKGQSLKKSIPKDTSAIVINFGLNGTDLWKKTQKLVNKLKKDFPNKDVYVLQTPHVAKEYSSGRVTASALNSKIDKYNSKMKKYCSSKSGVTFINPTTNIVSENGKGYLLKTYADGTYHLNHDGDKVWYKDIISSIKSNYSSDSDSSSSSDSSNDTSGEKTMYDVETKNYEKELKCDSGYTLDKDSIKATYKLDKDKYDDFLLEYIEYKFYTKGSKYDDSKKSNTNSDENSSSTASNSLAEAMVKVAKQEYKKFQAGKTNAYTYQKDGGLSSGQPWCAAFVSYVSKRAKYNGKSVKDVVGITSNSAGAFVNHFATSKKLNFYLNSDDPNHTVAKKYTPKPGDYVVFSNQKLNCNTKNPYGNSACHDHIGIVIKYEKGWVHYIDGNCNNRVHEGKSDTKSNYVVGYCSWY